MLTWFIVATTGAPGSPALLNEIARAINGRVQRQGLLIEYVATGAHRGVGITATARGHLLQMQYALRATADCGAQLEVGFGRRGLERDGPDDFSRWYDLWSNDPNLSWSLLDRHARKAILESRLAARIRHGQVVAEWDGERPAQTALGWLDALVMVATAGGRMNQRWAALADELGAQLHSHSAMTLPARRPVRIELLHIKGTRSVLSLDRDAGESFRVLRVPGELAAGEQLVTVPEGYWAASSDAAATAARLDPLTRDHIVRMQPAELIADGTRLQLRLGWIVESAERLRDAVALAQQLAGGGSGPYR